MTRRLLSLIVFALAAVGASPSPSAEQRQERTERTQRTEYILLTGRVVEIHAPRLFTVRPRADEARDLLVLSPRALSPEFVGATVTLEGMLRPFSEAELQRIDDWGELLDALTRKRFKGRPMLIATSLMAIVGGERLPRAQEPPAPPRIDPPQPIAFRERPRPLTIRAGMLAGQIEEFAGRPVRVLYGRVVGVFEPRAFLIEPATPHEMAMGRRDRVIVLIESASLRAPAELLVGSTVTVTGVARTIVGVQVTREVPWPAQLRPQEVQRLEVRAAILATSVQAPDGVELTDRQPATVLR